MTHQEVCQQQIIINQLFKGKEDHRTSAIQVKCMIKYSRRSAIVSGNNIPEQEAFGSKPQVSCHSTPSGFLGQLLRHAVLMTGREENPLYSGKRSM